jgi:hypothetical protein
MVSWLLKWALHTVKMWCDEFGLSVNPDKTGLVAFTRRKLPGFFEPSFFGISLKLPGFFEPSFFGISLHCSMSVKYLGVILGSWLTWREHVDFKVRKAHNLLWACRRAYGVIWALKPRVVHWLYVSVIRPSFTFAALVWWPGCQMAIAKKKLR